MTVVERFKQESMYGLSARKSGRCRELRLLVEVRLKKKIEWCEIQLFRERLSEKVHATIPKGIVGGFQFTVFQRNFKEWQERPCRYVCQC